MTPAARVRGSSRASLPPEERAREACLSALERRPHSRRELERKLRRKGIDDTVAGPVLDRLVEVGLVDDEAFARAFVASRQRRRPRGRRALERELAQRGVSRDVAARVLGEAAETENPLDAARRALAPRLRGLAALDPLEARRKAAQYLARRGFDYDTVRSAVEACLDDSPEA